MADLGIACAPVTDRPASTRNAPFPVSGFAGNGRNKARLPFGRSSSQLTPIVPRWCAAIAMATYSRAPQRIRPMMSVGDPYDREKICREFYKPVQREDKVDRPKGRTGKDLLQFCLSLLADCRPASLPMSIKG